MPLSPSLEIKGSLSDYIQFVYNRGKGSVSFRDLVLTMLSADNIRSLKGFKSFKTTRIDVSVYEFRLMETLGPIEDLLKKGVHLRFVADPSTFTRFKSMTAAQFKALSSSQKNAYTQSFDRNKDGRVSEADAEIINEENFVTIEAHKQLETLKVKFPNQVELVQPPLEYVSKSKLLNFPRLHHLKDVAIDFLKDGEWRSQISLRSSANLTDSCMSRRIAQSYGNKLRYVTRDFAGTNYAAGSQGNVQFGALFNGEALLASLQKVKEHWIALYNKKKHFDEGKLSKTILPRVVIEDSRGHRSTIETYYSEGTKGEGRKTVDPVLVALHHLSGPDKVLKIAYSSQFVSTHGSKNQALRYLMDKSGDRMEDFFVLVDGNFATQPYSALPQLAFAPSLSAQFGTLEGKAYRELPLLPEKLDWPNNIGVYEGGKDVYGAEADKLHAKVDYYEYVTRDGERHYLVVWGSANSSKNAGKGNADALHVLDTTDASVTKGIKEYFKALRSDSRVFPFSMAYLDRKFREAFQWDQRILNEDFLRDFSEYLSGKSTSFKLDEAIKELVRAKAHDEYGENLIKLLTWYEGEVSKPLAWSDLYVLLELANPKRQIPPALTSDLAKRWNLDTKPALASIQRTVKALKKVSTFGGINQNMLRILKNCATYLKRLGVQQNPSSLFTEVQP